MSPENSKPEWFQMTEEDGFAPRSPRKRTLRIMALATPLLVLGAGFVFAQTQDSPTASATSAPSAATASPISLSGTPTPASTLAPTAASSTVQASQASTTPAPKASLTIKKPAISKPTGGAEEGGLVRTSDDD